MSYELLCSIQLALYALGWSLAAWRIPEERPALLHWAVNGVMQALSGFLAMQPMMDGRSSPLPSLLLVTTGAMVSLRGVDCFLNGRPRNDRWGFGVLVPGLTALCVLDTVLPPGGERMRWLGWVYGLMMGLLMLWYAARSWAPMRREHGRWVTLAALSPMLVSGVAAMLSLWPRAHFDAQQMAQMREASRLPNAIATLVTSGLFNIAFLFLFLGRVLGKLRASARTDHVTGTLNRRAVEAALAAAWQRHRRRRGGLAVVLVDVDHFKRINDEHGHAVGDAALALVARTLQGELRGDDSVGRWGGEEFVLVLPEQGAEGARAVCERLRLAVLAAARESLQLNITASFGLAVAEPADDAVERLVERADAAMYEAKRSGRNRVCEAAAAPAAAASLTCR